MSVKIRLETRLLAINEHTVAILDASRSNIISQRPLSWLHVFRPDESGGFVIEFLDKYKV